MRGVSAAHQQGVIHRDLKPENIFLARTPTSAQPVPKVLDFGVSRMLAHEEIGPAPTTLTRTGHVVGTPSYMSLEQLRGSADVDKLVDVYALGVILYEALSGKRPYDAQNTHELVIRMATEQPTPLRTRVAAVDPTLAAIVMKALARLPGERHATVDAFADALEAWLAGDRTPLAPETVPSPAVPRARRLRWAVPLVLLVGALVAWLTLRSDPAEVPAQASPPKLAQEPEKQASPPPVQPSGPLPSAPTAASAEPERAPTAPGAPGAAPARKPHRPAKAPDRATHLRVEDF
jgi:serine/threonine protein kinase